MCGIAGFVTTAGQVDRPTEALSEMVASLEHRGPDDRGTWCDPEQGVYLGFRRLSILDLSDAGHQPMISQGGRYVLTFNGEIYNFPDLRSSLSATGVRFRSTSDTEVLLAGIERWGLEEAVRRARGMFGLVVWDRQKCLLHLVRDRMGIKPLYLLRTEQGLAWASECRAFHPCPLYDGRGNTEAAWHFLRRLYVPAPLSILEGVEKLPPGTITTFVFRGGTAHQLAQDRYWKLDEIAAGPPRDADETAIVEELHELLRESVRLRMVADVPVGAFLSGGIDSTLVVALMQEQSEEAIRTFTIRFDDPEFDEGPVADRVAEHLGTRHTAVAFSTPEVVSLIPRLPELSDEPMANPSLLPTLLVSRVARRDVTVALSGDGGDELFGGYNRYRHGANAIRRSRWIPAPVRRRLARGARSPLAASVMRGALRVYSGDFGSQHEPRERLEKLARILEAEDPATAYAGLLSAGFHEPPTGARFLEPPASSRFDSVAAPLESRMMLLDQLHYLPDDLLAKVDRASMWESLEVRVPLLDHEVVRWSWPIPLDMKIRNGVTKWPLREIASRYVPREILQRPKMGFTVPIQRWLEDDLHEWARDTLSSSNTRALGIWDRAALDRLWKLFEGGRRDLALPLYAAAVLQSWSEAWNVGYA